jgi:hypothetical protein
LVGAQAAARNGAYGAWPPQAAVSFPAMAPLIPLVSSERYRFSVIALTDNVSAFSYRDLLEGKPIIRSFGVIVAVSLLI